MKPIYIVWIATLMILSSCEPIEDSPPREYYGFDVYISLIASDGTDLTDDVYRVLVEEERCETETGETFFRKVYKMPLGGTDIRCYRNGEIGEYFGYPSGSQKDMDWGTVYTDILIEERSDTEYGAFWFRYSSIYAEGKEIYEVDISDLEMRFKLPAIFGEQENIIKMVGNPKDITLNNGKILKIFLNGVEITDKEGPDFHYTVEIER